ncbi:aquaporinaquaporin-like-like [Octopus vulgaris]|uniref:Aquaporinaquaporin-like-like n=1 Tax=Octopus vulgaris TaxID=6645 RepID=A0AA36F6Q8_OCTVU|nr:aquaporinaquaporin-like-like [Octopus vulgaris]
MDNYQATSTDPESSENLRQDKQSHFQTAVNKHTNHLAENCKRFLMEEIEDIKQPVFWRAVIAEFLGTAFLVCFAVGANMNDENAPPNGLLFPCIESGIFITIIIGTLGHISGGHVNPAVSLGFAIVGDISWIRCIFYTLAQMLGAVVGAAVIRTVAPSTMYQTFGVVGPGPGVSDVHAMIMELLITFLLLFGILAAVDKGRKDSIGSVPLHIGLIVSLNMFAAINITGGAMNPCRAFGPAVITGVWTAHWAYWIGPLTGSIIGSVLYDKVFSTRKTDSLSYRCCLRKRDKNDAPSRSPSAEEIPMKNEITDVDAA